MSLLTLVVNLEVQTYTKPYSLTLVRNIRLSIKSYKLSMKHYIGNTFIFKDVEVTSSFEGLINLEPSVLKDKSKDKTCFLKRLCDHRSAEWAASFKESHRSHIEHLSIITLIQ